MNSLFRGNSHQNVDGIGELAGQKSINKAAIVEPYWGLACGDAVGTTLEFKPPGIFIPIDDIDPVDQMKRYVSWYPDGYLSSTGSCFDIGNIARISLSRFIGAVRLTRAAYWRLIWGDDTDTTGVVYGQLVGVYFGEQAIPEQWRKHLR